MRKMKRILSFIMACVIFISSANEGVYATEIDESDAMVEELVETTGSLSESTETVEFTESVGEVVNETVNVSTENQQELPDVREYDDLLEMESVEIDPDEIEGEVYDADELAALVENMPAMMSTSYNLYWDNYSSYYIYNHLSEDKQKLWDALEVLCASYLEDETDLTNGLTAYVSIDTTETITAEDLMGFANMFKYAHPQYYYLRSGYSYYAGATRVRLAFMVYDAFTDGTDRKNATNAMKTQFNIWSEQIALGNTEEEKVKIIHDIICDKVDYNHGVLAGDNQITSEEEETYFTQSAYSVFCTDLTVCAGYTQTFMWLCNAFDIECFGVTSPGHAWNKVKVNDNWYNLDATWDDGVGAGDRDYHCYLKNDAYMESIGGHEEEEEWLPYLPSCTLDSGSDYRGAGTLQVITQKVTKPTISVVEEGTAYAVTIESDTDGAKIFYTLDGKTPSEANSKGKLYTGTFRINQTATIRAIAVCDGYLDSEVADGGSIDEIEYIVDSGSCGANVIWEFDSKDVLTISGSGDMKSYSSADAVPWYNYSQDIQRVEIEDGVTSIGDYAFYNSNLVEIEIPAGVTELGMYAFASCYELTHVKICGNPTTIGERVFEDCDKLTEIELSDTCTKIGTMMFFGCGGLVSIELPESLTEIGQQALSYCSKLEEIRIPAKVVMQPYAFYYNTGLKKVTIENGVTAIPYGAFNECSALEEIRIPKSVTSIGNIAIDATATIYGYAGSAAETYANDNGNTFVDIGNTEYEVHFVTGTDEQIASIICQKNSLITEPVLGNRTGYTFDGWYTSNTIHDEATKWDFANDIVTEEMTLYAYWTPNTYQLSFDLNYEGVGIVYEKEVTYDAPYGLLYEENRIGYTFLGWYTQSEGGEEITPESIYKNALDTTIYAHWRANTYTVTLDANGGALENTELLVTYGSTYGKLPVAERVGYTFKCWCLEDGAIVTSESSVMVEKDHSLYAEWIPNTYQLSYDLNYEGVGIVYEKEVTYDAPYGVLYEENREGYTFLGWYTQPEGGEEITAASIYKIASDSVIYAHWKADSYTVTFDVNGGELDNTELIVTFDDLYGELPMPTKAGYDFVGWFTDKNVGQEIKEDTKVTITAPQTLYARWKVSVYEVTFNTTGGEEITDKIEVTFGEPYGELPVAERVGYTFLGWYTEAEGGAQITEESIYTNVSDTTIYAQWSANTYKIYFDANGGIVDIAETTVTFDELYGELPIPVKEGYSFVGWYTDKITGQVIEKDTKVTIAQSQTLYARWEIGVCEVTLNPNGGTVDQEKINVTYGSLYGELPMPVKIGHTFTGWYTELEGGIKVNADTIVDFMEPKTLYAHWELKYKVANPVARMLDGTDPDGAEVALGTRIYLITDTNGAKIYFTKDAGVNLVLSAENGTLTEVAMLYEDAIELTESGTLYAIAVKEGYTYSEVMTVSYTVRDDSYNWGDVTEEDIEEQGFLTTADVPKELWVAGVEKEAFYTGKAITYPELRVYSYTTLLKEKTDYTVKYKNNKNAGEATITITGKGNYSGSIVKTFIINPLNLSDAEISNVTLQYNKKVQKATTKVTYGLSDGKTVTLKKGTDFNFIYPGTDKKAEDYDADAFKEVGTYTVYLVGKGNYYTEDDYSVAFEVTIVEETLISKMSLTKIPNQKYTGEEITPSVTLMRGSKKLEEGIDYEIVEYINNVGVGTASIVIEGMGDYVGTRTATFKITGTALSKVRMSGFAKSLPWTGEEVCQDEVTFSYTVGKGEEAYEEYLEEDTHYTVTYQKNISVGTATVIFKGIEENGYTGTIKKTYKITGISMKKVQVTGLLSTIAYDGGDNTQEDYELVYIEGKGEDAQEISLVEDTEGIGEGDYRVSYKNNGKAGTATITFTGINGYTGSINKTYKITAYDFADKEERIGVSEISEQTYLKGGVMPKPEVIYTSTSGEEILLVEGKDYTLKYSNNKAVADETAKKVPTVTITGKGNFKGKKTHEFTIIGSDLSVTTVVATDVVYQNKAGICKPSIKVYDTDGKLLKSNTDYQKTVIYKYAADVEVTQKVNNKFVNEMRFKGDDVEKDDIIPVGAEIIATVTGIKNYEGTEELPSTQSATFKFVTADIAKAKVTVIAQTYTGKAVEPTKDDITVKVGNVVLEKTDYEIVGYSNNVKKGTAKITIRGIGNYGGEKTVSFKINSKSMNYTIIFDKNAETATGTMKVASISAGKNLTANAYKNNGYKFVGWNTQADGSGYTYTDKEKFYFQGAMWIFGRQITLYAQWEKM